MTMPRAASQKELWSQDRGASHDEEEAKKWPIRLIKQQRQPPPPPKQRRNWSRFISLVPVSSEQSENVTITLIFWFCFDTDDFRPEDFDLDTYSFCSAFDHIHKANHIDPKCLHPLRPDWR
jgi:hypothetical protein